MQMTQDVERDTHFSDVAIDIGVKYGILGSLDMEDTLSSMAVGLNLQC